MNGGSTEQSLNVFAMRRTHKITGAVLDFAKDRPMEQPDTLPASGGSTGYASPGIDITAVAKLKHADLWAAAKSLGSQAALARHLGISQIEIGEWINLKSVPPARPVGRRWTEDYICQMESKLIELTGKSWDELFPDSLRDNAEFLACEKTIEKTATMESIALEHYAMCSRQRMLHGAVDGERREALRAVLGNVLRTCTDRDARILTMRFGLDGTPAKTQEEVGKEFGLSSSRVNRLEQRAVRRLQNPEVFAELEEYA